MLFMARHANGGDEFYKLELVGSLFVNVKLVAIDRIVFMRNLYERCHQRFACVADSILLESSVFPARDRISFVNQLPFLDCESKQQHAM